MSKKEIAMFSKFYPAKSLVTEIERLREAVLMLCELQRGAHEAVLAWAKPRADLGRFFDSLPEV